MTAYDIVGKKRDGGALSDVEITFMVRGLLSGEVADHQMTALLMAVFLRGMDAEETWHLTKAMAESGDMVDLSPIPGVKVDKHSTGGVGDKTTLLVAPLVAAAGAPVAKFTGRALGHTGGTVDKLESIPGFNVSLTREQFLRQVQTIGIALAAATENLAPADKKIYALRDQTATVESIPLIVGSILSKKLAGGADAFVFDVKAGNGAFMPTVERAAELADALVAAARRAGKRAVAIISDMNQPLGNAIGNALEVAEAMEVLSGGGPRDLRELCLILGAHMLELSGRWGRGGSNASALAALLDNGAALAKFQQLVAAQGGDLTRLPQARYQVEVKADREGYIAAIDTLTLGLLASRLGAGRMTRDAAIDPAVGFVLHAKIGGDVRGAESLVTIHANETPGADFLAAVRSAFLLSAEPVAPPPLIRAVKGID